MKKMFFFTLLTTVQLFGFMDYCPGEAKEVFLGEGEQISLLTWNILGLPNSQVAVRPWEERVDGIAKKILEANADVVILQECFERDLSLGLHERLKKSYAHSYLHLDEPTTPLPSGLALFSKLPVSSFRFSPHLDLLDGERDSKMGTLDFLALNEEGVPIAHIAASHFQGSSNCEWRAGVTDDGRRLSYQEVREEEAKAAFSLFADDSIPHYLCGDLNVDRRSLEFSSSALNAKMNLKLIDSMSSDMQVLGTNTNFWKHEKGLEKMYPDLSKEEILLLALEYRKLFEEKLDLLLEKDPWTRSLEEFDDSYFTFLEKELNLTSLEERRVWDYFKKVSPLAIFYEKRLWQENQNQGISPPVSIGRVLKIRALPIEESLDYILGVNSLAKVEEVEILTGYEDGSFENTLSDHHPLRAKIWVTHKKASL